MSLQTSITDIARLNPLQKSALEKLGIKTIRDLLFHLPHRYAFAGQFKKIGDLVVGEEVTIYGRVVKAETKKAHFKKIPMAEAVIEDETGKIKIVWFHQAFLAKKLTEGSFYQFSGKVTERKPAKIANAIKAGKGELYLANPIIGNNGGGTWYDKKQSVFASDHSGSIIDGSLVPIYPETRGITSGWFYHQIQKNLTDTNLNEITETLPEEILKQFNLPTLRTALIWVHTPHKEADARSARKRFAFEEVFFLQLERLIGKREYQDNPSFSLPVKKSEVEKFAQRFSFKMTGAQNRTIAEILADFVKNKPMTRLIEGDVGSGKTAVAATAAFAAVMTGYEVAYMAPTEILARQHFESFIKYFEYLNIQVGLLTGSECRKFPSKISPREHTHISRTTLLKWVATGQIPILVGTHALIQKSVKFRNLALVIIDEQHRFGVMQRAKLARKEHKDGKAPHLLSMTATPIPRTLALTIYGDLDLSLLDEMPAGRKTIITAIIAPDKRDDAYEKIRVELVAGRQVYVICPRIDEPDPNKEMALQVKSAKAEAKHLQEKIFPEYTVGLVHSKMKPKDKEEVMADFTAGQIDVLVATSVIEVGVNVPNATVIIIEGAERFGLAQLHQLRGRVLRSNHQAYCYIFSDAKSAVSIDRLKALVKAKNGFELAELDLSLRGAGSLSGEKQWGLSDLGMEALKNIKMVELARTEAQKIVETDPTLKNHPLLKQQLATRQKPVHFE
ncbi:MAG: ATP-dependent DNA helicase RecG [Candidatus Vogelbacteria bacterium RIFOXYD1_FULL_42_15]|uniref:Probable DNA 3'-5' helicase RecG n=1 Tax=Candidatus Vogelbacteria bacterium RIFOXYD1_FULL_42_15 TaxID=1802437 RepID=A0A1G2QJL4_9BACT|nr:MAG: ATP-dependent DNA helicase RecG [Candidatus Vogelbacteria bacterium RIFOXYD1_FULL_42_15]